jgi:hypothetical protein
MARDEFGTGERRAAQSSAGPDAKGRYAASPEPHRAC